MRPINNRKKNKLNSNKNKLNNKKVGFLSQCQTQSYCLVSSSNFRLNESNFVFSRLLVPRGKTWIQCSSVLYTSQVTKKAWMWCSGLHWIQVKHREYPNLAPKKKKVNTLILTQSLGVGSNALDLITCHNDDILILLATYLMPTQSFSNHDNKFALLALLLKWHEPTQHEFVTWITVSL